MLQEIVILCATLFLLIGKLRKVNITTSSLADNAASFVNQTSDDLHIKLIDLRGIPESTAGTLGDSQSCSIDEVPADQFNVNDSRSHVIGATAEVQGGTGSVEAVYNNAVMAFQRGDLVLEPDEALFMNISDISGALDMTWSGNIWYED